MENARRRIRALLAALLLLAGAACSTNPITTPTPAATETPTATSLYSTHAGPLVRATLPPTWTPTLTPLPSDTPTPTPVTPTLTPSPVPELADLCASLTATVPIPAGYVFAWDNVAALTLGTTLAAVRDPASGAADPVAVRFLAVNLLTGKNQGIEISGGQIALVELQIDALPGPGLYLWTISVHGDAVGDHCALRGFFFVARPEAAPETMPETTPTAAP